MGTPVIFNKLSAYKLTNGHVPKQVVNILIDIYDADSIDTSKLTDALKKRDNLEGLRYVDSELTDRFRLEIMISPATKVWPN